MDISSKKLPIILIVILTAGIVLNGCDDGSSGSSSTGTLPTTLSSPTVQSFTGDTYTVLDWTLVEGADSYNVYVTTDGSRNNFV